MDTVTCGFCAAKVTRSAAIADGWEPFWYFQHPDNGGLTAGETPACPRCARDRLDADGVAVAGLARAGGGSPWAGPWPPRFPGL